VVRKLTFAFAIFFALDVAIGYLPQITQVEGNERLLFGLFRLSLIDDITHGTTALAALAASLHSRRASLLFLTIFGSYYALDAFFWLVYGFFNEKPYTQDLALNLPHVLIATVMLGTVYYWAPRRDDQVPQTGGAVAFHR
jgi:hypothetical protein